jgi:molybdenum cofactor guanylyltransferase
VIGFKNRYLYNMKLTALILAGGQSRRMGANKALLQYHGKPLIRYSIELALQFTGEIIICANGDELQSTGFPVVHDIFRVRAPIAGIHAGLNASQGEWNLVLTCDMPHVSSELIRCLITNLRKDKSLVLPGHQGYIEPLCGFYHRDLIPVVEENARNGKLSPLDLLECVKYDIVPLEGKVSGDLSFLFRNMNEKKDLLSG